MSFIRLYAATIAVGLILITADAHAGYAEGTVAYVIVRSTNGLIYFGINGANGDKPLCATGDYWMIKDENSNAGKQQLATLLLAHATGKTVTVVGTDNCTRWSDGEDVDWVKIK